ncbi:MAG: DinB family protein [Acidobacteria bacterium]|nr:DinB family protein [Acidobacteriota bacterium]
MQLGKGFLVAVVVLWAGMQTALAQDSMVQHLRAQWEASRRQVVNIVEAMPGDKFQYRPTAEVRSFGEIVVHFAGENMAMMEVVAGVSNPEANERFDNLKTRPEILKALTDYFDYGAKVLSDLTDQQAMESVPVRSRPTPRWLIVMQAIGHSKEHYGNLVTYLRLNDIVPPSTADRQPQSGS